MSCPYFQKKTLSIMPQTPHVYIPFGSSRVQTSLRRTLLLIKNLTEEKEEEEVEEEEEEERGISEENMKMQHCNQPACREGGWRQSKQGFPRTQPEIFCLRNQPPGAGGRRNKQGFQPPAKNFYLRNQPAGTQMEAK